MIIYVFCQGFSKNPSGGLRILYDLVKSLNKLGYTSKLLIPSGSFNVDWYKAEIDVCNNPDEVTTKDIVIFHEESLWMFTNIVSRAQCKYIILNQGAHWSLTNSLGYYRTQQIYNDALGILVNSKHTEFLVKRLFGDVKQYRLRLPVGENFNTSTDKANTISYMPRRNSEVVKCIVEYIQGVHSDWNITPIHDVSYDEVCKIMSTSKIFLSFGGPEGFGLPPLEAALSGCKVIGYHGFGGEEFFESPVLTSIPFMEIPPFLDSINENTFFLKDKTVMDIPGAIQQIEKLRNTYNYTNFANDITNAFNEMKI